MSSDALAQQLLAGLLANTNADSTRESLTTVATRLTGNLAAVTVGTARKVIEQLLTGGTAHPLYMQLCMDASGAEHGVNCAQRAITHALVTTAMETSRAREQVLAA